MDILINTLLLIAGFILLIKGADWFVDGAAGIASKMGISQLVIGLTIVAMGTSAPEAAISISSAIKGSAGIAVGNVLGSNIMNILMILGITAVITPLAVQKSTIRYEIPFVIAITGILSITGLSNNRLGRADGAILIILFLCYLGYLFIMSKSDSDNLPDDIGERSESAPVPKLVLLLVTGVLLIILGSNLTVDSATFLAKNFGVSDRIIGLTIVAFGTSLPELATCITAAIKKNADIAIGNIVGSNIFNILFVLGLSSLITPIEYSRDFMSDSILCIFTGILFFVLVSNKHMKLKRIGGVIMVVSYLAYFTATTLL
ncbi:MAG: calcium/sodium antiporter [Clostridiales bacterium]|nr:calcium/sodium antiporter [Clostridiales bacterium]